MTVIPVVLSEISGQVPSSPISLHFDKQWHSIIRGFGEPSLVLGELCFAFPALPVSPHVDLEWDELRCMLILIFISSLLSLNPCFIASWGFPGASDGQESTCSAGDPGSIPVSRRTPGEGNDNPLQDSRLENPKDRGAWRATARGAEKSQT